MAGILKITDAALLGIHAMALLAGRREKGLVSVAEMAGALGASEAHLSKVMQRLGKTGLVTSKRGARGGFLLNREGASISLLEVYEAVEGPMRPTACLLGSPVCGVELCVMGELQRSVFELLLEKLSETTVDMLAERFRAPAPTTEGP